MSQSKVIVLAFQYESFTHRGGCDIISTEGLCGTINTGFSAHPHNIIENEEEEMREEKLKQVANIYNTDDNSVAGRVYDAEHEAPSVTMPSGGQSQPKIVSYDTYNKTKNDDGKTNTIQANYQTPNHGPRVGKEGSLRIRKLTPRECWRLMGVKDEDFDKVKDHFSDSTLYHLAGDSIVTSCLISIFGMMAEENFNAERTVEKELLEKLKEE